MKVTNLALSGVKLIEPIVFPDNRGYSGETYTQKLLHEAGIINNFVVDYEAYNIDKHTLRGIHFQNNPHAQTKLVRVLRGSILDVVVDLRRDSPTFREWISLVLSEENHRQIYIPRGYGHAFLTLEEKTSVLYKFDDYYNRDLVRAIAWNDPEIAVDWGISNPIISVKDAKAPTLSGSDVNLTMELNPQ